MTSPSITSATKPDQQQRAISTIVMGFSADPITRWLFPEPHQYLTYFTEFVPLMAGGAFEHGSAYCTDDFMAASLWLPPGVHSDFEAMGGVAQRAIPQSDQEKVFSFHGADGRVSSDRAALVSAAHSGRPGPAGEGLRLGVTQARTGDLRSGQTPAYLEATSPHNRRLYERHGFEAIGEIQAADSPPMWPMLRKPR